ncbi:MULTISPECIES: ATP-grasp domain-containing protein [unclassified Kitasatospora]|uniref:ATP-grasp domain-containing protein n=1 Tax=unclassified Kitasatospora TaxID=2633591 RepID=UPI0033CCF71D
MPTVLVLGGAAPRESGFVRDICDRAMDQFRKRGVRVVLTDTRENLAAAPELTALADEVHELDFADASACQDWAAAYARHSPVHAVVGYREYAAVSVASVAALLGVPGNPPEAVRLVRTKDECREHLRRHGFRQPELTVCASAEEATDFLREHGPDVVVKPRRGSSSEGVSRVSDPAAMAAAFRDARDADGLALVEEFVHGREFSVEGLFTQGTPHVLAVTEKALAPGGFVEMGHTMPAALGDDEAEVVSTVTAALRAIGLRRGHFHVECWVTGSGVVLGEVHARQGGDWIHAMLEWCHPELELYGHWLDDLLGTPPAGVPARATRGAAVRFLAPPAGVVTSVGGWSEVADDPSVLAATCTLAVGTRIHPVTSNLDRHGAIVVGAADAAQARTKAELLQGSLTVEVRRP